MPSESKPLLTTPTEKPNHYSYVSLISCKHFTVVSYNKLDKIVSDLQLSERIQSRTMRFISATQVLSTPTFFLLQLAFS